MIYIENYTFLITLFNRQKTHKNAQKNPQKQKTATKLIPINILKNKLIVHMFVV